MARWRNREDWMVCFIVRKLDGDVTILWDRLEVSGEIMGT